VRGCWADGLMGLSYVSVDVMSTLQMTSCVCSSISLSDLRYGVGTPVLYLCVTQHRGEAERAVKVLPCGSLEKPWWPQPSAMSRLVLAPLLPSSL
jgi:hypothetical protein